MPISSTDIQKLYVAFFNRPADPAGLSFWTVQGDIGAVARTMIASSEFVAAHAGMNNTAIIGSFYQNLFGRAPDAEGLAFWRDAMDRGVLDAASVATLMSKVTQGNDGATLANRAAFAASFTAALDTQAEQDIFAANPASPSVKALLNAVGADSASLANAQNHIDSTIAALFPVVTPGPVTPGPTPAIVILTTGNDVVTGTKIDNTFTGVANKVGTTYNAGDVLDGGDGTDTLALTSTVNVTLNGPNLTSIERLQVTATAETEIHFAKVTGITELINEASTGKLIFGSYTLHSEGVQLPTTLTINGASGHTEVIYGNSALTGNADNMTVNLNNYTGASPRELLLRGFSSKVNELESISFDVSGTNNTRLQTGWAQTSLTTLNIAGSGSLALTFEGAEIRNSVTTINAGTATGNISLGGSTASLDNATLTVTLGSGDDVVHMGSKLTSAHSLSGGAGTDTLVVSKGMSASDLSKVTGFEIVRFEGGTTVTQDASLASLAGVRYQVSGTTAMTLENLANDATVWLMRDTGTLTQTLVNSAGKADVLNLTLSANLTTLSNVSGLETLNLVSVSTANVITSSLVTAKHVIAGNTDLKITDALSATVLDASGFTGKLTVTAGASGSTITGGSGDDTITGGTGADTISGGAGNDTIFLGAQGSNQTGGADRITLGTGNDTVVFVGNTAAGTGAAVGYTAFAQISDFASGAAGATDLLRFSASDTDFSLAGHTGLAKGNVANGLATDDAMVLQHIVSGGTGAALSNASLLKLTTVVVPVGDIKATFAAAFGNGQISNLAVNGNYLISVYDSTDAKMVIGVVNVGGNGILESSDFTDNGIAVVGVVDMSALNYNAFNGTQLAIAI